MLTLAVNDTASRRYSTVLVSSISASTSMAERSSAGGGAATVDKAESSEHTSFLARGLSRSAAAMPQGLSDEELVKWAKKSEDLFLFDLESPQREVFDKEGLDADDPDAVALAHQATDYLRGRGTNPFKGMSRDQLELISYDESGTFTVNERRAASDESDHQDSVWRKNIVAKSNLLASQGKGHVNAQRLNMMLIGKNIVGAIFDKRDITRAAPCSEEVEQLTQDINNYFQNLPAIERAEYVVSTKALYS
ncbi:hypothetical protein [Zymobacter sp. IVIA_12111.31 C1]|uniref:hypothetical protein n=1 Tax=Zymobacter sp. IVIA_12111.31 C1 TaxID=3394854 RepID=UPI0039C01C66